MAIKRTIAVNIHATDCDVYAGRGSILGNKHRIGRHCTREQSIARYKIDFYKRIEKDPKFKRAVLNCKGKRVGCFCKPLPCHVDVIVEYLKGVWK